MERAEPDELTARVASLELMVRVLLARAIEHDPEFEAQLSDATSDMTVDDDVSDPGIRHRILLFHVAARDHLEGAQQMAGGWRAANARRSRPFRRE